MARSSGTLNTACRAAVALALLLTAGAPAADPPAPPMPPKITEVGGKKLDEWIKDLKRLDDPSAREEAIRAIMLFPNAKAALPALLDRLHDSDQSPRIKAVLAIGALIDAKMIDDKDRAEVAKKLGARLEVENQGPIKFDIAMVLGGLGSDAKEAIGGLLYGAQDASSFEIRKMCITVLAHAGMTGNGPDERVTRVLMGRLDDSAAQVRLQTIMTIAQLGKPADPNLLAAELRAMRAHMNDRDKTVAIWAHLSMMALDKIDDDDIKFLTQNTQTSELQRLRFQAVGALGMVGTKEKKVVPTLIALLKDEDAVIVAAACQALGGIGDPGEKAETALIAVANDQKANENVRVQAIYALASIGMKGKNAVPALIALFDDKDPNIVMTACHGIGLLDEPNGLAEQALMKLSQDGNASEMVRKYAKAIMESLANAKPKK